MIWVLQLSQGVFLDGREHSDVVESYHARSIREGRSGKFSIVGSYNYIHCFWIYALICAFYPVQTCIRTL